ncbi:hypothetical protein GCM10027596_31570 [Nocardioides korecus]
MRCPETLEGDDPVTVSVDDQGGEAHLGEVVTEVGGAECVRAGQGGVLVGLTAQAEGFLPLFLADREVVTCGEELRG